MKKTHDHEAADEGPLEIAFVGELNENETDLSDKLLGVPVGESCIIYFDCPGGSPYTAISFMSLMILRDVHATGVVTGECSSSALWPFAACHRRFVTPYSVLLFHPIKTQSEEHVGLDEVAEWARHFAEFEQEMDGVLANLFGISEEQLAKWTKPGRYLSGRELADAGLAELIDIAPADGRVNRSALWERIDGED